MSVGENHKPKTFAECCEQSLIFQSDYEGGQFQEITPKKIQDYVDSVIEEDRKLMGLNELKDEFDQALEKMTDDEIVKAFAEMECEVKVDNKNENNRIRPPNKLEDGKENPNRSPRRGS